MMSQRPLPMVDAARCDGSGRCVAVCPTECLDLWMDQASVRYPDRCLSCGACAEVCPTRAITFGELSEPSADGV
jgi:NAD-dependent dihydropyrimidine dehydrogenase PreA subunit